MTLKHIRALLKHIVLFSTSEVEHIVLFLQVKTVLFSIAV